MTTRKVQNPNAKGGAGFLWALLAVIAIAAVVIGLIFFNGRTQRSEALAERMVPVENLAVSYNEGDPFFTLTAADRGEADNRVSLFEDFSCSYCANLANETDSEMLDKIQSGELTVDLHPMNFLDGQGAQFSQGHSTRALAAELALASHGDVQALWNMRANLFENQQTLYNKLDNDDFADQARDFGASDEAVQDIRDGKFLPVAEQVGQENLNYQNETTGEAYTPRVMRDDQDLDTGDDITTWLDVATA
ncbi:DsbA family protein [Corynebacterium sp.]|uniref:DsbA family protein n=1 Tax=Corynebacterium sp. TaxID=1720 RepID=UPI002A91DA3E|nr:thioredoxin domain-containing protein [Corynebacterium sp.]MDY5785353.1 thioredoxin domain-containing protein [Corynebacterium sp.]